MKSKCGNYETWVMKRGNDVEWKVYLYKSIEDKYKSRFCGMRDNINIKIVRSTLRYDAALGITNYIYLYENV